VGSELRVSTDKELVEQGSKLRRTTAAVSRLCAFYIACHNTKQLWSSPYEIFHRVSLPPNLDPGFVIDIYRRFSW